MSIDFRSLMDEKYKHNQTIIKNYNNQKIKVITMKTLRTKGVEDDYDKIRVSEFNTYDSKMRESISRAKNKIFELAFCNSWEYFFTATLDPAKYDRTDLEKFHKDLTQWFRDYKKKYNTKIDFLLIPELHADGKSWHMHGFLKGIPIEHLKQFKIGDTMGKALAEKVKNGDIVYNWEAYAKKFGFCDLEPIRNHEAVSKYITKYINKNLETSVSELNAHLYYVSRGLITADTMKKGTMYNDIVPDFENDYCSVSWFPYSEELLQNLLDSIE